MALNIQWGNPAQYNYSVLAKSLEFNELKPKFDGLFKHPRIIKIGHKQKTISIIHAGVPQPKIDKLIITIPAKKGNDSAIKNIAKGYLEDSKNIKNHFYLDNQSKLKKFYAFNYVYRTPAGNSIYLSFEPLATKSCMDVGKKNFIRLGFNPKKLIKCNEFEGLLSFMEMMLIDTDITKANISRLDVCVDVPIRREYLYFHAPGYAVSQTYNGMDGVETEYIGAESSKIRYCIYDKAKQKQIPTYKTRIEARLTDLKNQELLSINPFKNVRVFVFEESPNTTPHELRMFLHYAQTFGIKAALDILPSDYERKKYRALLDTYTNKFWQPEALQAAFQNEITKLLSRFAQQ